MDNSKPFDKDVQLDLKLRYGRLVLESQIVIDKGLINLRISKTPPERVLESEILPYIEMLTLAFEQHRNV